MRSYHRTAFVNKFNYKNATAFFTNAFKRKAALNKGSLFSYFVLVKEKRLCVPQGSLRQSLVREAHEGGLMGHFGVAKTLDTQHEHIFWPHMCKFVHSFCDKCIACRKAKSKVQPHDLYTPLPIPDMPWVDISRDLILGLPKTSKSMDSIFVVVDCFQKNGSFYPMPQSR